MFNCLKCVVRGTSLMPILCSLRQHLFGRSLSYGRYLRDVGHLHQNGGIKAGTQCLLSYTPVHTFCPYILYTCKYVLSTLQYMVDS